MTRSFTKSLTSIKSLTSHRRNRTARRPQAESLEGRLLLTAGDLDTSFGSGGSVLTTSPPVKKNGPPGADSAKAVAIQSDGKILAAGYPTIYEFEVVRLNANGSLDNSFGTSGRVLTWPNALDNDMAVDSQGRIVLTGPVPGGTFKQRNQDVGLVCLKPDGTPDPSFGPNHDGKVSTDVLGRSLDDDGQDVVIQPDGKIVVVGSTGGTDSNGDGVILRYNANGSPDTSFGAGGAVVSTLAPDRFDRFMGVAIQPIDGKIVVCGSFALMDGSNRNGRFLARYNADGTLDTSFGTDGRFNLPFTTVNVGYWSHPITIQGDGAIVWAGGGVNGADEDVAVARVTAAGVLDTTFGAARTGCVVIPHAGLDLAKSVKIQADGKLVVVGEAGTDSFIARLKPDGTLDPGFGSGGIVMHSFSSGSDDILDDVAVQGDGKLVAVGTADTTGPTTEALLVARFQGGDTSSSVAAASLSAPSSPTAISPLDLAMLAPSTDLDLTELATEWLRSSPERSHSALRVLFRLEDR
jgi:uncharacterized delta-60 repeat protein